AGLSKLLFDWQWPRHVHLELLYPAMIAWDGADLNWLGLPESIHQFLSSHPRIGRSLAVVTLGVELGWPLSLFFPLARRMLPAAMFAVHVGIFLSSGILFLPLALLGLGCLLPWRRVATFLDQRCSTPPGPPVREDFTETLAYAALVLCLTVYPSA